LPNGRSFRNYGTATEKYNFLEITPSSDKKTVSVFLNRTDLHNAFNEVLIEELTRVFRYLNNTGIS